MTALWESPERLAWTLWWMTIIGGVGAGAATLCTVAGYFVNDRIVTLQALQTNRAIADQKTLTANALEEQRRLTAELRSVSERAAELTVKAQDAERGISDTYDFNGAHRQRSGGRNAMTIGEEFSVFQTIQKLYNNQAWSDLRDLCEAQITKTPTWLTPHLYSGVANLRLGDLAKGEERLQFVVAHAGSDPAYADASRILEQIKAAPPNDMKH
jgi:hypothetical protein